MQVLQKPLSWDEIVKQADDNDGWVEGIVSVGIQDIAYGDFENLIDLMATHLIGEECFESLEYRCVGVVDDHHIAMEVLVLIDR